MPARRDALMKDSPSASDDMPWSMLIFGSESDVKPKKYSSFVRNIGSMSMEISPSVSPFSSEHSITKSSSVFDIASLLTLNDSSGSTHCACFSAGSSFPAAITSADPVALAVLSPSMPPPSSSVPMR
eukprot:scaffold34_cov62-Phaeocystis_antarctica.AAC.14